MSEVKYAPMKVEYIDHMGSDVNVVNAARVSFAKEATEFDLDKDTKLINYLAKHNHWSPLAHTSISIRVKAPIFMARQFVKHQIGLVWNEESRRYIDDEIEFYQPAEWREKPSNVKQGSGGRVGTTSQDFLSSHYKDSIEQAVYTYEVLLDSGVAPEMARMHLPLSAMTNWIWTGSLVAFARIVKLRKEAHAQLEAQDLAELIDQVVAPLYPVSWKALMEHMSEPVQIQLVITD